MNRDRFDRLALEHVDAVYRMAMHLARNEAEAADLVQETYLRALRAADRFEERGRGMRPWLLRILHNVFRTARKSTGDHDVLPLDEDPPGETPATPVTGGPEHLDWERVDDTLKSAVERLRPECRLTLLLWAVEGFKYREIADITEVPIGTVMSRLHRARTVLAEQLSEWVEQRGLPRG